MTFQDWQEHVPEAIKTDSLWRMKTYKYSLFLADLGSSDGASAYARPLMRTRAEQLVRASGNISSSIAEGYSRGTGRARATFYEYALGSARETRDWYYKLAAALPADVITHRIALISEVIKMLITMIARERTENRRLSDVTH